MRSSSAANIPALAALVVLASCGGGVSRNPLANGRDASSPGADVALDKSGGAEVGPDKPASDASGGERGAENAVDAANAPEVRQHDSGEDAAAGPDAATEPADDAGVVPDAPPDMAPDSSTVDAVRDGAAAAADAPDPGPLCPAGSHRCGTTCVSNSSTDTCGPTACTACVTPINGMATCDGTSCGFTCRRGTHRCGNTCADDQDPEGCGPTCALCPLDPNGSSQCVDGTCRFQCRPGFHVCGTRCGDDMSPDTCGTSCEPCAAPTGGRALCVQGRCDQACLGDQRLCHGVCTDPSVPCDGGCPASHHLCGDTCRLNSSPAACGASCTPCSAPAGADATCDGFSCSYQCRTGFHACGGDCPPVDRSVACLAGQIAGNPMGYINAEGNEALVAISVAGHVWQVVRTPGGVVATDLTRTAGAVVTAVGDAWGYLRSDGVDAVVFRATDGAIHDMGRNVNWSDSRLTTPTTAAPPAHAEAAIRAYVRTDGRNAVVYRGQDNHLRELASNFGNAPSWFAGDLTEFLGTPDLVGNPIGYVRSDDRNAMVYWASDGHLHETSSRFGTATPWV